MSRQLLSRPRAVGVSGPPWSDGICGASSTPSRTVADQVGAATGAPIHPAYRWSSGRQPRTMPSAEFSCSGRSFPPSAKPGADNQYTASVSVSSTHKHSCFRIVDKRSRPASGMRPDTLGTPLQWRTATGIHTGFSETLGAAPHYTTPCGLLKQPDKQKLRSYVLASSTGESNSYSKLRN